MPRNADDDTLNAVSSDRLTPIDLVRLDWETGETRFWAGVGTIETLDGNAWTGTGTLGRVGKIEETAELRAVSVELTLSGISAEILDIAKGQGWQGRDVLIYRGVIEETPSGRQWVGEPLQVFGGVMDTMKLAEGAQNAIAITAESELIDLERTKARRYTSEDQQAQYTGDRFFDAVPSLQEKEIVWGRS